MATNASQLADEIRVAMAFPAPTSTQLIGWATGVLDELTSNGMATSRFFAGPHPISGMSASSMATKVADEAGYPGVSDELLDYCEAIVEHIEGDGEVFYTAPLPPPDADAWFLNGTISGLDGSTLASLIASKVGYPGVSTKLLAKATAIVDHIQDNAEVTDGVIA